MATETPVKVPVKKKVKKKVKKQFFGSKQLTDAIKKRKATLDAINS